MSDHDKPMPLADRLDACKLLVRDMGTFQEFTGMVAVPSDLLGEVTAFLRASPSATGSTGLASEIANAKRFDREAFPDDTEFADWAQSRARHYLSAVTETAPTEGIPYVATLKFDNETRVVRGTLSDADIAAICQLDGCRAQRAEEVPPKRYNIQVWSDGEWDEVEDKDGDWVRWSDIASHYGPSGKHNG